jgi:hypothetical protein
MIRNFLFIFSHTLVFSLVKIVGLFCVILRCKQWQQRHPSLVRSKSSAVWFEPFFPENAGYHWRAAQWEKILAEKGFYTRIKYVSRKKEFDSFFRSYSALFFLKYILKRFWHCFAALRYHTVIVRREITLYNDYGNLFMEKFLLTIHPNVILDFDDDIAASKGEPRKVTSWFGRLMLKTEINSTTACGCTRGLLLPAII